MTTTEQDGLEQFLDKLKDNTQAHERICVLVVDLGPRGSLAKLITAIAGLDDPPYVKGTLRLGHQGRMPKLDN